MKLTYNGINYNLTRAQLEGLCNAAAMQSGTFSMERANDRTDAYLSTLGILEEAYVVRDQDTRKVQMDSVILDLETAAGFIALGDLESAEEKSSDALYALRALNRKRYYLTEVGYGIVRTHFPMALCFLPGKYSHLAGPLCTCGEGNGPGLAHCQGCARYVEPVQPAKPVESPVEPVQPWPTIHAVAAQPLPATVLERLMSDEQTILATREPADRILVYSTTGQPVMNGDTATLRDGEVVTVVGIQLPRHAGSTGRVEVKLQNGQTCEYYPGVIGAEWR
jgi:hypothetical protein